MKNGKHTRSEPPLITTRDVARAVLLACIELPFLVIAAIVADLLEKLL